MKIALVANSDWYLYNYRLELAQQLHKLGHDVLLISPPGNYNRIFSELGLTWKPIRSPIKVIDPFNELRMAFDLFRLYQHEKPDLINHFTIRVTIYGSIAAKAVRVKKIINTITGLGFVFSGTTLLAAILRRVVPHLYKWALKDTRVVFQNPDNMEIFQFKNIVSKEQSVMIQGSGVSVQKFDVTAEPKGVLNVMLVARLLWQKGVKEFVEAANLINGKEKKANFTLVGASDPSNPDHIPQGVIDEWIESGIIEWRGWELDMPEVYKEAHIICLPTYGEGLPKVLLEACASGRPIIATDTPGCREVVEDGVNGFLIPPKDSRTLAKVIELLLQDSSLRKSMGLAGRKKATNEFSVEKINRQTISFYNGNW